MLNAVKDRNAIILGVLEVPKLQHLWTAGGPTPEAMRIRDSRGATVEPAVLTWVLLAFDLFNATGELPSTGCSTRWSEITSPSRSRC